MKQKDNSPYNDSGRDFEPRDGHGDWDPDDYEDEVQQLLNDADFNNEDGDLAVENVQEAVTDLTDEEVATFRNYIEEQVNIVDQILAQDPYEDYDNEGTAHALEMQGLVEAHERVEAFLQTGLSQQQQHSISQRMSLAMSAFGNEGGAFFLPLDVLQAIMFGTDFMNSDSNDTAIHIPIDLPEKTKKQLEKAVNYLLSISDATYWKNMAIATKKVGLTPLDGCIFMDVTIGMFGLKKPFVWEFASDRIPYINDLIKEIHNSKQGDKLYNFFTKLITFQYKGNPIPRSVAAALARDAFCLLYVEL